ncbi:TIGR00730 family Rossman fold protein [Corynebacterium sp. 153RC1]|uniref:TIGR00730 family Rossman fold protein n=1 Tax=unclassified Corynebacterium TaxID=2624378 RepID=UPI00211D0048|nr:MULTISPECIES: TIGR00730 family Rossman fold protein [unclassified Corynebacterium]MCQ9352824.1 TIGR00730 family Rossman fold protein [Corynebacterium sp. 209RC1]MCQ9355216.1 TIGR00730 family Rossman fold protein [Corynebacterium sp. 1222RC1]MCQ9357403.1 TIGR00730 family Rossman fold protein [Corynebacterium sp. 122RC1]MCQ9359669.1 TIGR00730 family Rossman fold protein [Corynebacterium sp. 142RC1]MCQ9361683.1 TIGR00730 family Rossman fold protein [Corynebacterium sp. 153RC1]
MNKQHTAAPSHTHFPARTPFPVEGLQYRLMRADDLPLRAHAMLTNTNRFAQVLSPEGLETPPYNAYMGFDPARGDVGLVLETPQGQPVGVAWVVFAQALGFVAPQAPELVMNVDAQWQGKGIGGWLIEELAGYGSRHGWSGISLLVEDANPARRLYARHGFVTQPRPPVEVGASQGTVMVRGLSPTISSVAVYCGSTFGDRRAFSDAARALGEQLAARGIRLVYGGGSVGLMGELASACLAAGGEVVGVIPRSLVDLELAQPGLSELIVTEGMAQRKAKMEELADAFIALPGGMGTLEELFEVLVRQQLGPYTGPVALLNTDKYWTPLVRTLEHMSEEGFIDQRYLDSIIVSEDIDSLFTSFDRWTYPGLKWHSVAASQGAGLKENTR